jgi:hypothetical protein
MYNDFSPRHEAWFKTHVRYRAACDKGDVSKDVRDVLDPGRLLETRFTNIVFAAQTGLRTPDSDAKFAENYSIVCDAWCRGDFSMTVDPKSGHQVVAPALRKAPNPSRKKSPLHNSRILETGEMLDHATYEEKYYGSKWGGAKEEYDLHGKFIRHEPKKTQAHAKKTTKKEGKKEPMAISNKLVSLPSTATVTDAAKEAFEAAAWQSAAEKVVELVKVPLLAALDGKDDDRSKAMAGFLRTKEGTALLSAFLGFAPLFSPALMADDRAARLAAEMQIVAAKHVTDFVASNLVGPVTVAFQTALAGLPVPSKKGE